MSIARKATPSYRVHPGEVLLAIKIKTSSIEIACVRSSYLEITR